MYMYVELVIKGGVGRESRSASPFRFLSIYLSKVVINRKSIGAEC